MQHYKQQQNRSDRNRRKDVEKFMEKVRRQRRGVFIRSTIQLSQGPETLEATERKRMGKKEKEGERESREWRGIICMYL